MAKKMSDEHWMDTFVLTLQPSKAPHLLNPLVLAYVGDAVYELYVRQYCISQANYRPHQLHLMATQYVSAKGQAQALEQWYPELSDEELAIVKRGRNAKSGSVAKNVDVMDYRHSTAFECLLGFLFYKGQYERLKQLMDIAIKCHDDK